MKRFFISALLLLLCIVCLFPVYAVVVMAFSKTPGFSMSLWPGFDALTTRHVSEFIGAENPASFRLFMRQLFNSVLTAGAATVIGIIFATSAAYALSRFPFPGRGSFLKSLLLTQTFPATMMIVPLYLLAHRLGLLDSILGLSIVYATTSLPFCVWMLKGYFDAIPRELDEAALMDGASHARVYYQVLLPLARPAIAVTALFSFLTAWNEFILAATFLSREELFTLPVNLYRHVGAFGADWGAFAAGSLIVSLPVCVVFYLLQRHLVSGLSAGGVKS